jgi:F-box/WD-40 domain protein 7
MCVCIAMSVHIHRDPFPFQCVHTLVGHTGGVWTSQVSEDGAIVVSGSTDRTVRVWSTASGECLHNLQGHTSTVRCMALKNQR